MSQRSPVCIHSRGNLDTVTFGIRGDIGPRKMLTQVDKLEFLILVDNCRFPVPRPPPSDILFTGIEWSVACNGQDDL